MDGVENPEFQIKLSELLDQEWFKIGIFLNVEERSLKAIKADFINFPKQEDKANEMIKKWFNFDPNPTFEKLILVIKKIPNYKLLKEVEDLANKFLKEPLKSPSNTSERNSPSNSGGFSTMPSVSPADSLNTEFSHSTTKVLLSSILVLVISYLFLNINFLFSARISKSESSHSTTKVLLSAILVLVIIYLFLNINFLFSSRISKSEITSSPNKDSDVSSDTDLSRLSAELKNFYLKYYGKIGELQPLLKASVNVDLIQKFVDLCIVDAVNAQVDVVFSVERKKYLETQMRCTPIPYSEIFMKEKSSIIISGIAGIEKTWFLRKCVLDWSNGLIWKNIELVFYLECRSINQYPNISNINDLLNVFYKGIVNDFNISNHTALFIIDGLDEFKYFNELLNPSLTCSYPIINAIAEIQKYKHVIAGRVYAIDQYQRLSTKHSDKLTIQIMGFNENGINTYVENHVIEEKKEVVKTTLKESPIAKAMASVPFYLSSMCKIISDSKKIDENSFLTMTDLYTNLFLYLLRKHIIKNNKFI